MANLSQVSPNRKNRIGARADIPDEIAKKLKSCSVLNCEEWRDLRSYTTYHCFPVGDKNQDRWEVWTKLLRKTRGDESWTPFRGSLVCSHHFREEDFVNDPTSKRRKLIKDAVPSIFPTFTVDRNDPTIHLPVVSDNQGDGENDRSFSPDDTEDYSFEYQNEGNDEPIQEDYEDEIQVINELPPKTPAQAPLKLVNLSHVSTNISSSNHGKKNNSSIPIITSLGQIRIISPPPVTLQSKTLGSATSSKQVILIPSSKITDDSNGLCETYVSSTTSQRQEVQTLGNNSFKLNQACPQTRCPPKISRLEEEEETTRSLPLPFSLDPDLDITLVDSAGADDLAACRQRISELEEENRSLITMYENEIGILKQNYEYQIEQLQRKLAHQEKLMTANQISIPAPKTG